jgi:hypothetical protein
MMLNELQESAAQMSYEFIKVTINPIAKLESGCQDLILRLPKPYVASRKGGSRLPPVS